MNVLKYWQHLKPKSAKLISTGFINQTYRIELEKGLAILQRLHPVFSPKVNLDILAITDFLASKGFVMPKLVKTDEGELWVIDNNQCWRMLTFMEGHTFDEIQETDAAYSAGQLVGRFHRALLNFKYDYQSVRENLHHTENYLRRLEHNLRANTQHTFYEHVSPIANQILEEARKLPNLWELPLRHCHGDLKISNLMFNSKEEAYCLIDLDTLGKMPWPIEMGDAFRSWCNPNGENQANSVFNLDIYKAALEGYQSQVWKYWKKEERDMLPVAIKLIPLELCARFLIDIFEDQYWNWDPDRFKSRAEHNWLRAQSQWSLFEDIERKL